MDPMLIGCWRVQTTDMIEGTMVRLIGGLPGEYVEFTEDGRYRVDIGSRTPGESRYHAAGSGSSGQLDVWISGLESLGAQCLYRIASDLLTICVAGDSGPRPTDLRRDDQQLWCVMTFERSAPPKRRRSRPQPPLLEPESLIPTGFLKPPRRGRGEAR